MKIKQQQQQQQQLNYSNNISNTNIINTNNNLNGLSVSSSNSFSVNNSNNNMSINSMTSNQTSNSDFNNSLFTNAQQQQPLTTIWTRSAAFKAAQQESIMNENLMITSNLNIKRNHSHNHFGTHHSSHHSTHHHGHYQHVLGKIVKPIPVRPMSSSSSSSSTHSSLFNSSNSNTNHLAGVLKSINQSITNTSNLDSSNLNPNDIEIDSINSSNNTAGNFSLIAKYFASFPATRLKSTSSSSACTTTTTNNNTIIDNNNIHHNVNCPHHPNSQSPILKSNDLFATRNHETPTPTLAMPQTRQRTNTFMPFKKSNQFKQSTTSPASNLNETNSNTDKIQSSFTLRSQSAFNNKVQLQQQSSNSINNSNNTFNNTDHLCTNFKRMIKLSDNHISHTIESDPASPLTAASNTPTFDSSNLSVDISTPFEQTNSINTTANFNHTTFTFPNFDSETDFVLPLNSNQLDNTFMSMSTSNTTNSSGQQSARFGQITMETRSTRKFLIKHHPYLQLNSNINNNSTNTNKLFNQQRPSINLIKMKKLCSKSNNNSLKMNDLSVDSSSSAVTRSSGRISRTNLIDNEDSKLLKFTDTAPLIQTTNLNQSSYSLRVKNSATTKTTNSNTKSTRKSSTSKTKTISNTNNANQSKTEEWCCCFNSDNYNETSNEYDVNNCFDEYDDDQEEDSSGYYSSYQSVDLVSTSGGGSIIGDKEPKSNDLKSTQNQQQQQSQSTQQQQQQQQQVPVPQHHYHTRYLTNFLQQTSSSNLSTNTNSRTTTKTQISTSNTTPTTRLRYQQQLAAAAAAAKTSPTNMKHYYASQNNNNRFHEQYQLECDLDLDQIEND